MLISDELGRIEYPKTPSLLYEPIDYILGLGGKRMRPILVLMAYQLFDKNIEKAISESYRLGLDVVKIIVYAFACFGVYQLSFTVLDYYKLNELRTKIFYVGAFINVVFSIVFIDHFGILSPAYGTLLGFGVIAICSIFYSLKYLEF